ncbi:MAG: lysylphosphatidylglycerol synthase transmembrane domain-containing protein [Crocinitomicaceae bacterium]|nr:lysylphosphatidylglycerol synthase transmembrane domain-containing protein [Crocinitomicaceae bacterium]
MENENQLKSAFSSWKIVLAIVLGLGIAGWMVYRSLNQTQFIEVETGMGTHIWSDINRDQHVDSSNPKEFTLSTNGNYRQQTVSDILRDITWTSHSFFWILMALLFMVGRDLAYMWRIRILTQKRLSWKSSFHTIMLWEFASALSPGVVGGSAVAMFILNKEKIELGRSTAIVVITTMMDNLFYIILVPLVFLFISPTLLFPADSVTHQGVEFAFWIAYSLFTLIGLILFVSVFWYPQLVGRFLGFIFRIPFLNKWRSKALKTGEEIVITSKELKKENWRFWFTSFLATLLSWTSRYMVINAILAAFLTLRLHDHVFIFAKQLVLWLLMIVSPTPGGSGVAEYAFGELMSDFTHSALLLAGLALLWRLISYFPYLFIGAIILPRWLRKK